MPLARQALHEAGEDVHAALWPTVHEMHQVASRQYAFEGRCYVLAAGSLMRAAALPPELELHPDRVRGERMTLDVAGHYARPDALSLAVRRTGRRTAGAAPGDPPGPTSA